MKRYQSEHFCLYVHAQDHWEEKDEKQLLKEVIQKYSQIHGHSNCEICLTCPVCQSLWALFDPMDPGENIEVCEACKELYMLFDNKQGKNSAIILFSHDNLRPEKLLSLTELLLEKKRVKKINMTQLDFQKDFKKTFAIIEQLETKKMTKSEYIELLDKNEHQTNVSYEISKDRINFIRR